MVQPATKFWSITPTPAGFLKSRYPSGDDSAAPPVWSTIPDFVQKSAPFSVDVTQFLTGSYDVLSLAPVTGLYASGGWSLIGPLLTYSGSGTGLFTVRIAANLGSQTANSNVFTIESIALPTIDTLAPTTPTELAVALNGANQPVVTFRPAMDQAPAGAVWKGIQDYVISRNGTPIVAPPAAGAGLQLSMQRTAIGSPAIAGSTTQSPTTGRITMTAGGVNYFDTLDDGEFFYAPVTGDFFATFLAPTFTSASPAAKLMIDARASTDANAAHVAASLFPYASARGTNLYYRAATGGTTVKASGTPSTASPLYLALERIGTTWNYYTSTDGLTFALLFTATVSLPATVLLGIAGCAQVAGASLAATIDQWAVTQDPPISYTDTSALVGVASTYAVQTRDLAGNLSAPTNSVSITPPVPNTGGGNGISVLSEDWGTGTIRPAIWGVQANWGTLPPERRIVQSTYRRGSSAFSVKSFLDKSYTQHPERTEIAMLANNTFGVEYWMGISIMLLNWGTEFSDAQRIAAHVNGPWDIVWQDHGREFYQDVQDPAHPVGRGLNPPADISARTMNDGTLRWVFHVIGDTRTPEQITDNGKAPPSNYQYSATYPMAPYVSGQWADFVLNWRLATFANPTSGFYNVWCNDVLYANFTGCNCFPNSLDTTGARTSSDFIKIGMYKGWVVGSTVVTRELCHGPVFWGRASDGHSYNTVDPVRRWGPR